MRSTKVKIVAIIILILAMIVMFISFILSTSSMSRWKKSMYSEYSGGLDRIVMVYDYNGNVLETYEGKIDLEESDVSGKVKFDLDGKRTIIYGGVVIVQEK